MIDHPCKGLPPRAREAFEQIATGNALPATSKGVIQKLLARGLIGESREKTVNDALGSYSIPQYFIPLRVHAQWCEWCGEQPDDEAQS